MEFNGIEHYDQFEDETIFWTIITDVPQVIQNEAKAIDREEYSSDCFGMCVCYDKENKKFDVVTDTDLSTGASCNLYYIDNDGDKHWFQADMPQSFVYQVFAACNQINERPTEKDFADCISDNRFCGTHEAKHSITEQLKKAQKQNQAQRTPKKDASERER